MIRRGIGICIGPSSICRRSANSAENALHTRVTLFSISHPCVDPTEAPPKRYLTPMVVAAQLAKERPGLCPPRPVDCFNEIVRRSSSFAFTLRKLATDWMANEGQTDQPKNVLYRNHGGPNGLERPSAGTRIDEPTALSPPASDPQHRPLPAHATSIPQ